MQLQILSEFNEVTPKIANSKNVVLTDRDLEILDFIMEMKFASCQEVFEKFFKITRSETEAKSSLWAQKRLSQLEQAKFLKSTRSFSEITRFYSATFKSYYALSNIYPDKQMSKPVGSFDQRTYVHDWMVLKVRLHLESNQRVTNWISDRKLRSFPELSGRLSNLQVPDGIYTNPYGEKVAIEVELAQKAKPRYITKIKNYVQILRSSKSDKRKFESVHYVCSKESVLDLLQEQTKIYGDLFKVQSTTEFFGNSNK